MNDDKQIQEAFVKWLVQKSGAKSEQELQAVVQKLGEKGMKQAYQQFLQEMQGQVQSAKQGAKLYLRNLTGLCPDGTAPVYYKNGGKVCKKCAAMKEGDKMPKKYDINNHVRLMEEFQNNGYKFNGPKAKAKADSLATYNGMDPHQREIAGTDPKSELKRYKEIQKKENAASKKANGGMIELSKCGGKAKKQLAKKACGGVKLKSCGGNFSVKKSK